MSISTNFFELDGSVAKPEYDAEIRMAHSRTAI